MKEITLLHGEIALVDDADYDRLAAFRWRTNNYGYAVRSEGNSKWGTYRVFLMHREILGSSAGEITDHANGIKLDNQRANLRPCTAAENSRHRTVHSNSTGFKGVYKGKRGRYRAAIVVNRSKIELGRFDTARQAARAYDTAARRYHKEFACPNFDE